VCTFDVIQLSLFECFSKLIKLIEEGQQRNRVKYDDSSDFDDRRNMQHQMILYVAGWDTASQSQPKRMRN